MNNPFKSVPIKSSEITPRHVYLSRRDFIKTAGVVAGSLALAASAPEATQMPQEDSNAPDPSIALKKTELGDPLNADQAITSYNTNYEFTTHNEGVASLSQAFTTSPSP